jgi:hypothetical protein
MSALADSIRLPDAHGESVVELLLFLDDESVHPKPRRVGSDSSERCLAGLRHEVEETGETRRARCRTRESPDRPLERDGRLGDSRVVRAACRNRSLERFVQRADMVRLATQVILDRPGHAPNLWRSLASGRDPFARPELRSARREKRSRGTVLEALPSTAGRWSWAAPRCRHVCIDVSCDPDSSEQYFVDAARRVGRGRCRVSR